MKILLISDTHCEMGYKFPNASEEIMEDLDLIVLAGDIGDPYETRTYMESIPVETAYIAGNHEFYGYDYDQVMVDVFNNTYGCYNNYTLKRNGFNIHLTTLWSYLNPYEEIIYREDIKDCLNINNWSPMKQNLENSLCKEWLESEVNKGDDDLIFTHHSPSYASVVPKWKGHRINASYHNRLENFIEEKHPLVWGHGHIHNHVDYQLFDTTRVIANPKGLPHDNNNYEMAKGLIEV